MSGMNGHSLAGDMMKYIDASPTPFHMCAESSAMLLAAGFVELQETDAWLMYPHSLEGLSVEEIREHRPALYEIIKDRIAP